MTQLDYTKPHEVLRGSVIAKLLELSDVNRCYNGDTITAYTSLLRYLDSEIKYSNSGITKTKTNEREQSTKTD